MKVRKMVKQRNFVAKNMPKGTHKHKDKRRSQLNGDFKHKGKIYE